uniref:Uncharacterized protein n=1 Tax=Opuntia streptacantha TaxID=393608 RepID=A0A7C9CIV0_OPUST
MITPYRRPPVVVEVTIVTGLFDASSCSSCLKLLTCAIRASFRGLLAVEAESFCLIGFKAIFKAPERTSETLGMRPSFARTEPKMPAPTRIVSFPREIAMTMSGQAHQNQNPKQKLSKEKLDYCVFHLDRIGIRSLTCKALVYHIELVSQSQ